jgi:hypothetical protein
MDNKQIIELRISCKREDLNSEKLWIKTEISNHKNIDLKLIIIFYL